MSEPILIQVVLLPSSARGSVPPIGASFEALENWARNNSVIVRQPADRSEDTLRFATLEAADRSQAEFIRSQLAGQPFVDAVYEKPADEAP